MDKITLARPHGEMLTGLRVASALARPLALNEESESERESWFSPIYSAVDHVGTLSSEVHLRDWMWRRTPNEKETDLRPAFALSVASEFSVSV